MKTQQRKTKMKKKIIKKKAPVLNTYPYTVGKAYMIVTVTRYYTGKLIGITDKELVLTEVAWIAHTDRYSAALTTGVLRSVEPIPGQVILNRGGIIEVSEWNHALPLVVK